MTPTAHLLTWATPARCKLLNGLAFDRHAGKSPGTFTRFLKRQRTITLERTGVQDYYPLLRLVGYLPPREWWTPGEPLTAAETSSDLRTWFTDQRLELISRRAVDVLSEMPLGVLNRYLNEEPHITFEFASLAGYYPTLSLLGFIPPG